VALRPPDGARPGHLLIAAVSAHVAAGSTRPRRDPAAHRQEQRRQGGRWACLGDLTQDRRRRPVPTGEVTSGARRELLKTAAGIAMVSDNAPSLRPRLVRQVQAASQAGAFLQAVADGGVWPISSASPTSPRGQPGRGRRRTGRGAGTPVRPATADRRPRSRRQACATRPPAGRHQPSTAAGITWLLMDPSYASG